jgi:hypothetical protein
MSFKTFLEAFDKPYEWKKVKSEMDGKAYAAKLDGGRKLKVLFEEDFNTVEIIFFVDNEVSLTGGGDAFRILATVKEIIEKNIKYLKKFSLVYFTAKTSEKSRIDLYKVFSKMLKKKLKRDFYIQNDVSELVYNFPHDDYRE